MDIQSYEKAKKIVQAGIYELMSSHVDLTLVNRDYQSKCPFCGHESSFKVSTLKGVYHCFECHRSGDAIMFLALMNKRRPEDIASELLQEYSGE
jgi:DNA primase